jgi:carotenoid cleavage dioxygenase-like enzyme
VTGVLFTSAYPGPEHPYSTEVAPAWPRRSTSIYNYAATNEPGWFLFNGLVKHDTLTGREERYQFEPVRSAARSASLRAGGTQEDDREWHPQMLGAGRVHRGLVTSGA